MVTCVIDGEWCHCHTVEPVNEMKWHNAHGSARLKRDAGWRSGKIHRIQARHLNLGHAQEIKDPPLAQKAIVDKKCDAHTQSVYHRESSSTNAIDGQSPGNTHDLDSARRKRNKSVGTTAQALTCTGINMKKDLQRGLLKRQARNRQ